MFSVVIMVGYNLFSFGIRSFSMGESQANIQHNIRIASDFIAKELRMATTVDILTALPDNPEPNKSYIIIENDRVSHKVGFQPSTDVLNGLSQGVSFNNSLFTRGKEENILAFLLSAKYRGQSYNIDSTIHLLNSNFIGGVSEGKVVAYSNEPGACDITYFGFAAQDNAALSNDVVASIVGTNITAWVPKDTNISSLIPVFTTTGSHIMVGGILQESGVTANDFSHTIIYSAVAHNGNTKDYNINVYELSDTPPEATGVRIVIENSDSSVIVPYDTSTLRGLYNYIDNENGPEGDSIYNWFIYDANTENYTQILGKYDQTIIPSGLAGQYLVFGVRPVSKSGVQSSDMYFSEPLLIFPSPTVVNPFWLALINDAYYLSLTPEQIQDQDLEDYVPVAKTRTDYNVFSSFIPDREELNLTISGYGAGAAGGSHISKDISNYVDDLTSFSITIDAQVHAGSGWGLLINGNINANQNNRDTGYMFQFDPGARGFVVREINNGSHSTPGAIGAWRTSTESLSPNLLYGAVYHPSHLLNDKFEGFDFYKRYQTEITTQIQIPNGDLIFRVVIIDEDSNRSNEMWFGDFGNIELNRGKFEGRKLDKFKPAGSHIGLRTWDLTDQAEFKVNFHEVTLGEGFAMNVQRAEFVSNDTIDIYFDKPLQDSYTDKTKIKYNNVTAQSAEVLVNEFGERYLQATFSSYVIPSFDMQNGSTGKLTIEKGAVKMLHAGTVRIANGSSLDVNSMDDKHLQ